MIANLDYSWQRLELRHLAALEAIGRTGSFRRAASALGYSQAAISGQVAALEEIVGTRVLDRRRGARSVALTPTGAVLVRLAEHVLAAAASARAEVEAQRGRAILRVGVFQSASVHVLPAAARRLRAEHPGIEIRLHETVDPDELGELLRRRLVDVAFTVGPPADPRYGLHLLDDPYLLLVARDHPLARRASVTPEEIVELPLIDYRTIRHDLTLTARLPAATGATIVFRSDDNATIHSLVAAGVGVAVLPRTTVARDDPEVCAIPIAPPLPPRTVGIVWSPDAEPSPALAAFIAAVRAAAHALDAP